MELIIRNLTKSYGTKKALDDVSVAVHQGELLALVGPNGSGKSTLIKIIATILSQTSGQVSLDSTDVFSMEPADLAFKIGYVPQFFSYTRHSTVFEMVLLGRRPYIRWIISEEELSRVQQALNILDIQDLAGLYIDELSGGERQKVFIARAIAQEPRLFLLDEPTASLDIRHQIEVMELLRTLAHTRDCAMVVAVHDLNLAYRYADTIVVLREGKVAGYGSPEDVLTPEKIAEVYGIESLIIKTASENFILPVRTRKEVQGTKDP